MPRTSDQTHAAAPGHEAPKARPRQTICGDLDMRIDRNGTWFYHGSPIGRKELVRLFSTVLKREDDGSYWLETPVEKGRIIVEDAPFLAVEMEAEGAGRNRRIRFRTNVDDWVTLDDDHPLRVEHDGETGEPSPYVLVRPGLEARINRPVFYELVEMGVEEDAGDEKGVHYGVWSTGTFFPLGTLTETD
ncbi:DUF1285 domain-containing protein [Caenispirillum bisanense]|uniref:DUF1285 domain-containing protein n=1 Tax=Caenispirillum bisanense TaxID=414052 RepID=UPI0031D7EF53